MRHVRRVLVFLLAAAVLVTPAAAKVLKITQGSTSTDVVHYRAYWRVGTEPVTKADTFVDLPAGTLELDLTVVPEMATLDGVYSFGVSAVDDGGLESSILQIGTADVDHVPPDPPVAAHVE